jgi:glycosyltransferase involved in cell wall biosynthesis
MKICYLFSDGRRTGPADLVIQMAGAMSQRGHEVVIAYPGQHASDTVRRAVEASGVPGTDRFALDRYLPPVRTLKDLIDLPRFFRSEAFDVVHSNLRHDQALGVICTRLCPKRQRPLVVHSAFKRHVPHNTMLRRLLFQMVDGVIAFTTDFRDRLIERFNLPPHRVMLVPPTIDTVRFGKPVSEGRRRVRAELGIDDDVTLIGTAARLQPYRQINVFLEAAQRVIDVEPRTRFMVMGKSSRQEQSFLGPRRQLGLEDHVIAAGYRKHDYADYLAATDIFTLLMPGSDGTARAVREAMAVGCACVVSDFGMLPQLVPHEHAGLVTQADPNALTETWLRLIRDGQCRRRLGAAASRYALQTFAPQRCAEALEQCYCRLAEQRRDS